MLNKKFIKGLNIIKNHLVSYPTPNTISYAWSFGSLAVIFLSISIFLIRAILSSLFTLVLIQYIMEIDIVFEILTYILSTSIITCCFDPEPWPAIIVSTLAFFFGLLQYLKYKERQDKNNIENNKSETDRPKPDEVIGSDRADMIMDKKCAESAKYDTRSNINEDEDDDD